MKSPGLIPPFSYCLASRKATHRLICKNIYRPDLACDRPQRELDDLDGDQSWVGRVVLCLTRLSQLEGDLTRNSLQISGTIQKVCTKLIPAAVGLSA